MRGIRAFFVTIKLFLSSIIGRRLQSLTNSHGLSLCHSVVALPLFPPACTCLHSRSSFMLPVFWRAFSWSSAPKQGVHVRHCTVSRRLSTWSESPMRIHIRAYWHINTHTHTQSHLHTGIACLLTLLCVTDMTQCLKITSIRRETITGSARFHRDNFKEARRKRGCCKRRNALDQTGVVTEGSMRASARIALLPRILSTTHPCPDTPVTTQACVSEGWRWWWVDLYSCRILRVCRSSIVTAIAVCARVRWGRWHHTLLHSGDESASVARDRHACYRER